MSKGVQNNEGNPLVVGFNWGAKTGKLYEEQNPDNHLHNFFLDNENTDLGSMSRIKPFIENFLPNEKKIGQTNYCFFRSHKESDVSTADIQLCEPIFIKLLNYLNPSLIISFSARLRSNFKNNNIISDFKEKKFPFILSTSGKKRNCIVAKAIMKDTNSPIYFLPHPNAQVSSNVRNEAWKWAFSSNTK